jgi:protein-disulfide isomerase
MAISNQSGRTRRFAEYGLMALMAAASVMAIIALWPQRTIESQTQELTVVSLEGAMLKGDRDARVVLIEHGDLFCPACRTFSQTIFPELEARHVVTGELLFAYRHFPLGRHPLAVSAAAVAECAGRQGRFWEAQAAIFALPSTIDDARLRLVPASLELDEAMFESCVKGTGTAKVREERELARALGFKGTPTFQLGWQTAEGSVRVKATFSAVPSITTWSRLIKEMLQTVP